MTGSIPFHFLDWTGDLLQDGWVHSPSVGVREMGKVHYCPQNYCSSESCTKSCYSYKFSVAR